MGSSTDPKFLTPFLPCELSWSGHHRSWSGLDCAPEQWLLDLLLEWLHCLGVPIKGCSNGGPMLRGCPCTSWMAVLWPNIIHVLGRLSWYLYKETIPTYIVWARIWSSNLYIQVHTCLFSRILEYKACDQFNVSLLGTDLTHTTVLLAWFLFWCKTCIDAAAWAIIEWDFARLLHLI